MTTIAISSGHGLHIRGASGSPIPPYLDEVNEARRVVAALASDLIAGGVTVKGPFNDDTSTSQNQNLNTIVNWHNAQTRDLDVSVHFNSSSPQTGNKIGTECLYVTQQALSAKVATAIASAANIPDRGAKKRTDLFFLNNTAEPAILIEVCFVSSSGDAAAYNANFDALCKSVAVALGATAAPPQPEPSPTPEPGTVDIVAKGNVVVTVNGTVVYGTAPIPPAPTIPSYQTDVIATEFYGTGANGAYGIPIPGQSSSAKYLALPWKDQALKNKQVKVINHATGASDIGEVWDLGPWFIDDNYPSLQQRPEAETLWKEGKPCPRGPNKGVVPNGAGIDLSPALMKSIGLSGKGNVDWQFVEEGEA
jgi:hypothetical protein